MDSAARVKYLDGISKEAETFSERLKAMLGDTWGTISPYGLTAIIAIGGGAVVGLLLVWFIAKIIIALAYSIVGTATIFLGTQAALLGVGIPIVSDLQSRPVLLPIVFLTMTVIGWIWQLFYGRPKPKREVEKEAEEDK